MAHVILYKGQFVYNALNTFVDALAKGFEAQGVDATVINAAQDEDIVHEQLKQALADKPLGVIGMNGIGQYSLSGRSLYDEFQIPYVQLLMDDPMHHIKRLSQPIKYGLTTCVDRRHLSFLNDYFNQTRLASFLPHAGTMATAHGGQERPIDVLFTGTGVDPEIIVNNMKGAPEIIHKIFRQSTHQMLEKQEHVHSVVESVALKLGIVFPANTLLNLCLMIEQYFRAYCRLNLLRALDEGGIAVDIYGQGWEFAQFKHHTVHGPVDFQDSINLILQAKAVLNASPMFSQGTHDRVFSSMLNGALAVTNRSTYFEEHFTDEEDILFYDWKALKELPEKLESILGDTDKWKKMTATAKEKARQNHTWNVRAKELMDMIDSCAVLNAIS